MPDPAPEPNRNASPSASGLEKDELIQIVPGHKWGGCIAVVDEPKSFGCRAYVMGPVEAGVGHYFIRLAWTEFERLGVNAIFIAKE